jgi:Protein of unknown function (DUF3828)
MAAIWFISAVRSLEDLMITRRSLVLTAATLLAGLPQGIALAAPASNDPLAIVNAIYARAAKGKGDGGGAFLIEGKAARAKNLSKSLAALWIKADAHTRKGDVGPVDFDPVTNSQEPDVESFTVTSEKSDADKATIAVTITGANASRPNPADAVIRYDFVRDAGQWKIDDISGADDGKPWSLRGMLTDSLKN